MLTKHSFGVYGTEQPEHAFRHQNLQSEVDATPKREVATDYNGTAEIEAYTVMFGGGTAKPTTSFTSIYSKSVAASTEPSIAHLACRLPDGRRTWANLEAPDVLESMCTEEFCGRQVRIDGQGTATIA